MNFAFRIVVYILAAVSFWYSTVIFSVHSGSKFFLFWDLLGLGMIALGLALKFKLFVKLPKWINITLASLVSVGVIAMLFMLCMILSSFRATAKPGLDYVIVLGAQVRADGPSKVLTYRLDKAVEYLKESPETICIVSGGRGSNEPVSEAECMAEYLISRGIDSQRILLEDKSVNTSENIRFSKKLIKGDSKVGIITNNFHMRRGLYLAGRYGLSEAVGIASESKPLYMANNIMREMVGLIKDFLVRPKE